MLTRLILAAVMVLPATASRPNFLFLIADDLSTALSGYGHPQCRTPNLDKLANRGVTFTRAYCQFSVCGPSRASIMTGQYPITNGVTGNGQKLPEATVTLPVLLRRAGYWTGRSSKIYHMGVPGHIFTGDPGSDHAPSWEETYNVSVMESLAPGKAEDLMLHDVTPEIPAQRVRWKKIEGKGGRFLIPGNHQGSDFLTVEADQSAELADTLATNEAIRMLRERKDDPRPFFLAVGFVRPHVPLVAPEHCFEGYDAESMTLPEVPAGDLDDIPAPAQQGTNARRYKLTEDHQRKVLRAYYASITHVDEEVGRLLEALDTLGFARNTIVVFLSDHGYHLGEHTMWQKMSVMEEGGRVPLIIADPSMNSKSGRCPRIVESIDLYPTLAEQAGLAPPESIQGHSLVSLLEDPAGAAVRDDALIQAGRHFALRSEKWALLRYYDKKRKATDTMLYDMENDPNQFTNLAGDPSLEETKAALINRMNKRLAEARR